MTETKSEIDLDAYIEDAKTAVGDVFASVRKALGLPEPTAEEGDKEPEVDPLQPFVMNPAADAYRVLKLAEKEALQGYNSAEDLIQVADRYIRLLEIGGAVQLTPSQTV
jgi:hypothetical protein